MLQHRYVAGNFGILVEFHENFFSNFSCSFLASSVLSPTEHCILGLEMLPSCDIQPL